MSQFKPTKPVFSRWDQAHGHCPVSGRAWKAGLSHQTLLGVTASGKTFTIATVSSRHGAAPGVIMAPEKDSGRAVVREFLRVFSRTTRRILSFPTTDYYQLRSLMLPVFR